MNRTLGAYLTYLSTLFVFLTIVAGGLVHATGSGLACPDWPLCFGEYFPTMEGPVLYEHGHRLIAGFTGVLVWFTGIYNIFLKRTSDQAKLYLLGMILIVIQAVLGGLTVLWKLPSWVSTAHFIFAHGTLAVLVILSWSVWRQQGGGDHISTDSRSGTKKQRWIAGITLAVVSLQMVVGAWLRHIGSPGAPMSYDCQQFPLCNPVWVQFMPGYYLFYYWGHRVLAVVVTLSLALLTWDFRVFRERNPLVFYLGLFSSLMVVVQILLGELTVRLFLAVSPATMHLAGANLIFISLIWLMMEIWDTRRLRMVE